MIVNNWKPIDPAVEKKARVSRWDTYSSPLPAAAPRMRSRSPPPPPIISSSSHSSRSHHSSSTANGNQHSISTHSTTSSHRASHSSSVDYASSTTSHSSRLPAATSTLPRSIPPLPSSLPARPLPFLPSTVPPPPERLIKPAHTRDYRVMYDPATDPAPVKKGKELVYRYDGKGVDSVVDPRNATSQSKRDREKAIKSRLVAGRNLVSVTYIVRFSFLFLLSQFSSRNSFSLIADLVFASISGIRIRSDHRRRFLRLLFLSRDSQVQLRQINYIVILRRTDESKRKR